MKIREGFVVCKVGGKTVAAALSPKQPSQGADAGSPQGGLVSPASSGSPEANAKTNVEPVKPKEEPEKR